VAGGPKKRAGSSRGGEVQVHTSVLLVVLARPLPKHLLQLDSDLCGVVSVEDVADKVALCPHRQHLQPPADDPAHEVAVPQLAVRRGELDKVCTGVREWGVQDGGWVRSKGARRGGREEGR
jgi:hypothetical protein